MILEVILLKPAQFANWSFKVGQFKIRLKDSLWGAATSDGAKVVTVFGWQI